jgi:hypothetical protein
MCLRRAPEKYIAGAALDRAAISVAVTFVALYALRKPGDLAAWGILSVESHQDVRPTLYAHIHICCVLHRKAWSHGTESQSALSVLCCCFHMLFPPGSWNHFVTCGPTAKWQPLLGNSSVDTVAVAKVRSRWLRPGTEWGSAVRSRYEAEAGEGCVTSGSAQ